MASVTPPLNTAAPVPSLPFFSIMPGMLTASPVPETPPANYNAGTTYGLNATVSEANPGADNALDVYRSLQAPNTGHTPSASPSWWVKTGTTYPVWTAGTYAKDDRVIDAATHYEWLSLVASNTATPGTDETKWQLQGATNRFRLFDLLRNDVTTMPSGSVIEITPGRRVDSVGAIGVTALSVLIEVVVSGVTVWSATEVLSTRVVTNWFEYFYGDFSYKRKFGRFDLPQYTTGVIRLTFTGIGGADVSVSRLVVGKQTYLGTMQYDAESDALNFSKNDRSDTGAAILIPKRSIPKVKADIRIPAGNVTTIERLRDEDLNAVPALWGGVTDDANPYFEPLLTIGVYKQFPITMDRADSAIGRPEIEET